LYILYFLQHNENITHTQFVYTYFKLATI